MSFALQIKQEVLSQELSKEQALAFIQGVVSSSATHDKKITTIKINNNNVSDVLRDLLMQMDISFGVDKENKNWITLEEFDIPANITMPAQFFAGTFVGGGSISSTDSTSYHLEIQIYSNQEAIKIQKFLNKYSFNFTLIQRRKMWVLYIKKSEQISDFLKAIQAFNSLLDFEDARINRDFQNQLNRYGNLDIHNQQRLADSTNEFLELYEIIVAKKMEHKFREPELKFFELKKTNPYSSLSELVELMSDIGIIKTRAGLNHWIIKLRKIATALS